LVVNLRLQADLADLGNVVTEGGYRYVLLIIDTYSKFTLLRPLKTKSSAELAPHVSFVCTAPLRPTHLNEFNSHSLCVQFVGAFFGYGIPVLLHTDNGTEFAGEVAKTCKAFGVEQVHGRPYHPQSQGCVERRVQTLKRRLAAIFATGDCTDWERALALIEFQINITWTASIGMSPWEAVYGQKPHVP